jgi:hypothetical protein
MQTGQPSDSLLARLVKFIREHYQVIAATTSAVLLLVLRTGISHVYRQFGLNVAWIDRGIIAELAYHTTGLLGLVLAATVAALIAAFAISDRGAAHEEGVLLALERAEVEGKEELARETQENLVVRVRRTFWMVNGFTILAIAMPIVWLLAFLGSVLTFEAGTREPGVFNPLRLTFPVVSITTTHQDGLEGLGLSSAQAVLVDMSGSQIVVYEAATDQTVIVNRSDIASVAILGHDD